MRRRQIFSVLAGGGAFLIVPRHVLGGKGFVAPSDKVNIAGIGTGAKGFGDLLEMDQTGQVNIAALCEVDDRQLAEPLKKWPNALRHRDFRRMLEKQKEIDAVVVATPDHTHAVAGMMAMRLGKHLFCEKPLTHDIYEARRLTEAARKYKVVTQLGNQGHAGEGIRLTCEWIWDGAIGDVERVETWTNGGGGALERPRETPPVPPELDWDLWLGTAPLRPYHPAYHPQSWRDWWDFGTGSLGDMASHIIDMPYMALKLGYPDWVEAETTLLKPESPPAASTIRFQFSSRGKMPPVQLIWYDGGRMPKRPEELEPGRRMGHEYGGALFHGSRGILMVGCYGDSPRLIPERKMREYQRPPKSLPRSVGHYLEFIEACKGKGTTGASFDYAGPFTEMFLLGILAIRTGWRIEFDPKEMRVTNCPEANRSLRREYRKGWAQ